MYLNLFAAFKGGFFKLCDFVRPEYTCCEDVDEMVETEHVMTVYSSNSVMTTKYICLHCQKCDKTNRADGKKQGMLVVTEKVYFRWHPPYPA